MTVNELKDALTYCYWQGVTDTKNYILDANKKDEEPTPSIPQTFSEDLDKLAKVFINEILIRLMAGSKVPMK